MSRRGRLPGAPDRERIVCHVDVDCFYAACERLREPALRGEPVVVGMGYEPGETAGAVATASYEARAHGVESAQPISEALAVLPRKVDAATDPDLSVETAGFYRPVDMEYYESVAAEVKAVCHEHADAVREVSIDEAYVDVTDRTDWPDAPALGRRLKAAIADRAGVTASVGIAPTMSAAKVASDREKPDGLVVVEPGEVDSFLAPLDVEAVHGVGPVTAGRLREMGIETGGDLAAADPARLGAVFGKRGRRIVRFARGEDDRAVEPRGRPKSLSRESAFRTATTDPERQHARLRALATDVAERADRENALYATIGIKVITEPYEVATRAQSLSGPVADPALVRTVSRELFAEFVGDPVRKLGVRVSSLSFTQGDQETLGAYADPESAPDVSDATLEDRVQQRLDRFGDGSEE